MNVNEHHGKFREKKKWITFDIVGFYGIYKYISIIFITIYAAGATSTQLLEIFDNIVNSHWPKWFNSQFTIRVSRINRFHSWAHNLANLKLKNCCSKKWIGHWAYVTFLLIADWLDEMYGISLQLFDFICVCSRIIFNCYPASHTHTHTYKLAFCAFSFVDVNSSGIHANDVRIIKSRVAFQASSLNK